MVDKIGGALLAVVIGLVGAIALFWILDRLVRLLPGKWENRLKPYAYLLPAVTVIGLFLIYPAVTTVYASFLNEDSTEVIGFENYIKLFSSDAFLSALFNNILWIVFAPVTIVAIGMLVAVLADKMRPSGEKVAKSFIFLPMAISMVGASTIWRFIYAYQPEGEAQIGILNAIVTAFGGQPQAWLQIEAFRFNTALLMFVYIWTQVGYAMVLLSAAIKSVPEDTIEAGRIDGAGEVAIFFRIIVPQAWPTVITVFITVLIGVMKVFDIVYAMTNGNFNTDVIGNAFYNALFSELNQGRAAAIVVVLMVAVIPIMVYQVRQFRKQEANS
jgi:alpha-glucoside transport system permease protein